MVKLLKLRVWILVIALILSLIAISPNPFAKGVEVKSVDPTSAFYLNGINVNDKILEINDKKIETVKDFYDSISYLTKEGKKINVVTSNNSYDYDVVGDFGFVVDENLTVVLSEFINKGEIIKSINNNDVESLEDLNDIDKELFPKEKIKVKTNKGEISFLTYAVDGVAVREARTSNLVKGLDFAGGSRALIKPVREEGEVSNRDIQDLISVISERLNLYGLADVVIKPATDLEGNKFIVVEMAGVTREEIKNLIGRQGKFEARIGDKTVFVGGKGDIAFVCRDDGSCSGVRNCDNLGEGGYQCVFEFSIKITEEAANRQAEATKDLEIDSSSGRPYLSKTLDFYIDDKKVDSLFISADLKGQPAQSIAISGPGFGENENIAIEDSLKNMKNLQTILITGGLPVDIEVVKLDTISPLLGKEFVKNAFLVAFFAILGVALVIYVRYRNFKILIPVMITSLSEVVIILGFAGLFQWNLDLVAIAGIIAAVGTGVDDQIIITDEILKKQEKYFNWKERIKRAFFIIMTAWATTFVAMLPLMWAGAGLIRGFALVTIVGVTIGVLITRPAFAAIAEFLLNK